jgi:hypothetical protein
MHSAGSQEAAVNSIKNIIVAATLSTFSLGYLTSAQAAETVKPLQGVSFHTATKDATAYYLAEKGTCKVIVTITDKVAYAPARFEQPVEPGNPSLHQLDDAKALEFACAPEAKALSINELETVARH